MRTEQIHKIPKKTEKNPKKLKNRNKTKKQE